MYSPRAYERGSESYVLSHQQDQLNKEAPLLLKLNRIREFSVKHRWFTPKCVYTQEVQLA